MEIKRLFSPEYARGKKNYINSQKRYETARTVLYFAISITLLVAGILNTGDRINFLTVIAVIGCLPASKSAVSAIMFHRFHSCSPQAAEEIEKHGRALEKCVSLYDMVFTSYKTNYFISHMAVCGIKVYGYTEDPNFDVEGFYRHIGDILKKDGSEEVTVKIFKNLSKYTEQLEQIKAGERDEVYGVIVTDTLKSVVL